MTAPTCAPDVQLHVTDSEIGLAAMAYHSACVLLARLDVVPRCVKVNPVAVGVLNVAGAVPSTQYTTITSLLLVVVNVTAQLDTGDELHVVPLPAPPSRANRLASEIVPLMQP
jgi:hypothetical protein